ncbi:MAG: ComEC family competence protein, partial [Phycisphaeraceae bacterium]|nr:ComEC family competence protein [Phycisphaeraceae bacterium]
MYQEPLGLPSTDPTAHHLGWLAYLALAAMIGVAMGNLLGTPTLWLTFCFMLLGVGAFCICKRKATPICRVLLLMAAAAGFANWYQVHHQYLRADDVRQYASGQSQLIQLTGTIISPIHLSSPQRGALGQFSYQSPATLFVIATDTITRHGIPHQASGNVLVKVQQIDPSLNTGNRIQCTGWLRKTQGPSNPGEYDYRQMLAGQDIFTRLTLPGVGTLKRFETQGGWNSIRRFRAWRAAHAVNALSIGMDPNGRELGLLQIMLLGQRGGNLDGLDQAFRSVGLAHLLSISGAHLGILLFLTLIGATIFTQYPHRAVWVVVIVLTFYMIVVPTRVPIARAGVMAAAFCFCSLTGLTIGRINILGLAVLFVLIWRPADLFTPGFQLSFGTVAGLIAFVPNVSRFLWPDPQVQLIEHFRHRIGRRIADYIAVNFVAFSIALPMVAYHYQMLSPWNMILTMLALPIVTLMLGFGFLKIMLGMFFPSMALLLNGLTTLATQTLSSLVENGTTWTFASIGLGAGPTVWWMLGTLIVISALFTGMFAYRRRTLLACLTICILWL